MFKCEVFDSPFDSFGVPFESKLECICFGFFLVYLDLHPAAMFILFWNLSGRCNVLMGCNGTTDETSCVRTLLTCSQPERPDRWDKPSPSSDPPPADGVALSIASSQPGTWRVGTCDLWKRRLHQSNDLGRPTTGVRRRI